MKPILRHLIAPAALVVGLGGAATLIDAARDPLPDLGAQTVQEPSARTVAGPESLATAFRAASRTALPAVVYIQVEAAPRQVSRQLPPQLRGTPFEQFYRGPQGPPEPQSGSGSGFIISPDGYILTNNHVVEDASRVTVVLTDEREFDAEVVGRDPNTDIAVLKVDGRNLPTVKLGDAEDLQIGDWVLALGYPLGLGETATAGIVSAKGRSIDILRQNEAAEAPLEHFIQTDAAINPGNSGGPLVDMRGRVIGVNSAIASPTGFYSGYGFAIPVNLAKRVADDLIRYGAVHRPRLGVQINDVSPADAEVFRLPNSSGVVVSGEPQSPAREAGIRMGDVIVGVNGESVDGAGELMQRVALRQPGERVMLDVIRYGERLRIPIQLGQFQAPPVETARTAGAERDAVGRLGFQATDVTPAMVRQFELPYTNGVVVTGVDRVGPAAGEVQPGMRIEKLNGRDIRSVRELRAAAESLKPGSVVSIVGRLPDGTQTITNYRLRN